MTTVSEQPTAETEHDQQRAAYIDGLRQIADFLEANPDVNLPHMSSYQTGKYEDTLNIYIVQGNQKDQLATIARAMGRAEKVMDGELVRVFRRFAGIALVAQAHRDQVCERVVTNTREVIEEVPDPEALAAATASVPLVPVARIEETVEWRCTPLLANATTAVTA